MVDDNVAAVSAPNGIRTVIKPVPLVSETETEETDDYIVCRLNMHGIVRYADTISGSGLSGYGEITVLYVEPRLQMDDSGHIEDYRPRA